MSPPHEEIINVQAILGPQRTLQSDHISHAPCLLYPHPPPLQSLPLNSSLTDAHTLPCASHRAQALARLSAGGQFREYPAPPPAQALTHLPSLCHMLLVPPHRQFWPSASTTFC